jgi:hypothetical protein
MSLKRRVDKLEPVIEGQRIKRLAALGYQIEVAEGLLRLYHGLDAAEYARAETVLFMPPVSLHLSQCRALHCI